MPMILNGNELCAQASKATICFLQPKSLTEMTGYTLDDLMPVIEDLHQIYLGAPQHAQQSVREKYKGPK